MGVRCHRNALVCAVVSLVVSFAVTSAAQERPPKKSKVGKVVAVTGASVFIVGYAPPAWMGIGAAVALCPTFGRGEGVGTCAARFAQWAVPVAGPYLFLSAEGGVHSGFDRLVAVDAALQTAGAAALVTGIVIDLATPTAKDHASARVDVVPMIGGAMNGAAIVGHF